MPSLEGISWGTQEDWLFKQKIDLDRKLSNEVRTTIVDSRVRHLRTTEWQRWTPFVGMGRLVKDSLNGDLDLLKEMHSPRYNMGNALYNSAIAAGTLVTGINAILSYIG